MTAKGRSYWGPGGGGRTTGRGALVRVVAVELLVESYWVTYGQCVSDDSACRDLPIGHGSEELPDGLEEMNLYSVRLCADMSWRA